MTIAVDRARTLLTDLIAIDSVNPMGGPCDRIVEAGVNDYLEDLFASIGVKTQRDVFSDRHENLIVELAGGDAPATLFESHADTVPADDWGPESLLPRTDGDLVIGRGACDDKGSLVAMMLAIEAIAASADTLRAPLVFVSAGDEEYAQTGIKRFITDDRPIGRAIFGEPTSIVPIIQHKGTVRWDITAHGRSAHTSRPENGVDAIRGAMRVVDAIADHQASLQAGHDNLLLTPPTLTVTMIRGGRTRNAVADGCTVSVDYRVTPGNDPMTARAAVIDDLARLGLELTHSDVQLVTPPLATAPDDPFAAAVRGICRDVTGRAIELEGRPYGTDASWVSDRCASIVLGPGNIDHAHAIGEQVDLNEVVACAEIYRRIIVEAGA